MKRTKSLVFAGLLAPLSVFAAPACTLVAGNVTFGNYDVASSIPVTTAPLVTITCSGNPTAQVGISASSVSGSVTDRKMKHATLSDLLSYNLYTTSSYDVVWGNSSQGGAVSIPPKTGNSRTIYARIPAGQDVSIGNYKDTVSITVTP